MKKDANHKSKEILKRESTLTRFIMTTAPTMPREQVIKYFERMKALYEEENNEEKVLFFNDLITQIKSPEAYLKKLDESRLELFENSMNNKTLAIVYNNLIDVYRELNNQDKVEMYSRKLKELSK